MISTSGRSVLLHTSGGRKGKETEKGESTLAKALPLLVSYTCDLQWVLGLTYSRERPAKATSDLRVMGERCGEDLKCPLRAPSLKAWSPVQ